MNIFFVDRDPVVAARCLYDNHVNKMVVETAQLLCTAHALIDDTLEVGGAVLYRPTHRNHPSAVWVRQSRDHYEWLYAHFVALCDEYRSRYGRVHKTDEYLRAVLKSPPTGIPEAGWTDPPQCMPPEYQKKDAVDGYRNYYINGKAGPQFVWRRGSKPPWAG